MPAPDAGPGADGLHDELRALPKVDLHRHLEGSLRLQTLAEIAHEHRIDLPGYAIEDLRRFATVTDDEPDFHRFLEKFRFLRRFYPSREAVQRVAIEAVADAADDNVKYLELRFNPVALARAQGFSLEAVTAWVCDAVQEAQRHRDIHVKLIVQIGREESLETAHRLAQLARTYRDRGIVGLDLAGDEQRYPASPFIEVFRRARRDGLHVTVHAGEAGAPSNVEEAIKQLEAERIGHGVRSIEDASVLRLLRDRGVALEICPTSNIQTGVVQHLWHHPLPRLIAFNLRVSINTDDPSVSDTTLTDEYWVAMQAMGITLGQVKQAIITAAEVSFQPPEQRTLLADRLRSELGLSRHR